MLLSVSFSYTFGGSLRAAAQHGAYLPQESQPVLPAAAQNISTIGPTICGRRAGQRCHRGKQTQDAFEWAGDRKAGRGGVADARGVCWTCGKKVCFQSVFKPVRCGATLTSVLTVT